MNAQAGMTREAMRRLQNQAATWNERARMVKSDAELAKVMFDRAKAAARRAQRSGRFPGALHELAEMLATWSARQEDAEARHGGRDAS